MPRTPSAFPFSGRLRRRAINPTPPKKVKAWGDGPLRPEVMYPVVEHSWTNCAARNHSRSRAPHHTTQSNTAKNVLIFILRPTSIWMWHKAVFKVGPIAGPKPNTTGSSKNASCVGIPLFVAPQASGDKPQRTCQRALKKGLLTLRRCYDTQPQLRE